MAAEEGAAGDSAGPGAPRSRWRRCPPDTRSCSPCGLQRRAALGKGETLAPGSEWRGIWSRPLRSSRKAAAATASPSCPGRRPVSAALAADSRSGAPGRPPS